MSRIKVSIMALFAIVALSAMIASSASAAGWHVNGTELAKGSKQALTTAATVDTDATLSIVTKSETSPDQVCGYDVEWHKPGNHRD